MFSIKKAIYHHKLRYVVFIGALCIVLLAGFGMKRAVSEMRSRAPVVAESVEPDQIGTEEIQVLLQKKLMELRIMQGPAALSADADIDELWEKFESRRAQKLQMENFQYQDVSTAAIRSIEIP